MKKLFILAAIFSLNVSANNVYIDDLDMYNGVHNVTCEAESGHGNAGIFIKHHVLTGEYGWHIKFSGDGSIAIPNSSDDLNLIILDGIVKSDFGLKYGRSVTYDLREKTLVEVSYDHSWRGTTTYYKNCVETDEISDHDPREW